MKIMLGLCAVEPAGPLGCAPQAASADVVAIPRTRAVPALRQPRKSLFITQRNLVQTRRGVQPNSLGVCARRRQQLGLRFFPFRPRDFLRLVLEDEDAL